MHSLLLPLLPLLPRLLLLLPLLPLLLLSLLLLWGSDGPLGLRRAFLLCGAH